MPTTTASSVRRIEVDVELLGFRERDTEMHKIRKFRELSGADKLALASLWWLLFCAAGLLRWGSLRATQRWLRRLAPPRAAGEIDPDRVKRLSDLASVAGRHHLRPMRCLERSLAVQALLSRHGELAELRIGVQRDGGRLVAHAWLVWQGQSLDAFHGLEGFEVLESV